MAANEVSSGTTAFPVSSSIGSTFSFLTSTVLFLLLSPLPIPCLPPWVGMPTRLNDIPHSREIRKDFYADACRGARSAVAAGLTRLKVTGGGRTSVPLC